MTVVHTDGRKIPVTVRPVTQVAFERKFSCGFMDVFSDIKTVKFEHLCFLAFHAERPGVDFDDWLETVETIDWDVEAATAPFSPAGSAGSSPPSP